MRRRWAYAVAPLLGISAAYILAGPWGFQPAAMAGILIAVLTLWLCEACSLWIPPILGLLAALFLGLDEPLSLIRSFYNKAVLLLFGSFVLARALEYHQLSHRVAARLMHVFRGNPVHLIFVITAVTFFFSMWISNSAATAMMLPMMVAGIQSLGAREDEAAKIRAAGVIFVAYAASLGGTATPVGTPTNLLGLGMMETMGLPRPGFFQWMMLGGLIALICYAFMLVYLKLRLNPLMRAGAFNDCRIEYGPAKSLTKMKALAVVFVLTVLGWVVPGLLAVAWGTDAPLIVSLNAAFSESNVALLSAAAILLWPVSWQEEGRSILPWRELKKLDWGTLVLFGASIALGGLLLKTGFISRLSDWVGTWPFLNSDAAVLLLVVILGSLLSELMSNTATVNLIVPLAYALATAKGINPQIPVLGAILASNFGFLLPVSTPPNALAYATGYVRLTQMISYGIFMDILGVIVIVCVLLGLGTVLL